MIIFAQCSSPEPPRYLRCLELVKILQNPHPYQLQVRILCLETIFFNSLNGLSEHLSVVKHFKLLLFFLYVKLSSTILKEKVDDRRYRRERDI